MKMLKWVKYKEDKGLSYYISDSQTLAAKYALGRLEGDTFYAMTPELKCRDAICGALVTALANEDMEGSKVYGASFGQHGNIPTDRLYLSVATRNVRSIINKIGILHSLEKFYSDDFSKIHRTETARGNLSKTRIVLEAPACWLKSVPMLSFYLLLIRSFNVTTDEFSSYVDFVSNSKVKDHTDGSHLIALRHKVRLPALMANCDYIFEKNPITGYDDALDHDFFAKLKDDYMGNSFYRVMSYGINAFARDLGSVNNGSGPPVSKGRDWVKRYEELRQSAFVKAA